MTEPKGKKSTAYKNRYNQQKYDSLRIVVPAGQKSTVETFARERGDSINGVTNKALLAYMGLTDWPERADESTTDGEPQQQEG